MAKALRVVLILLCIGFVAMPYVNATDGLYTNEGQAMKFVWSEVLTGDCTDRDIQKDFEDDGESPCVEPLGFASQDLIPIVIGALIVFSQLFLMFHHLQIVIRSFFYN